MTESQMWDYYLMAWRCIGLEIWARYSSQTPQHAWGDWEIRPVSRLDEMLESLAKVPGIHDDDNIELSQEMVDALCRDND